MPEDAPQQGRDPGEAGPELEPPSKELQAGDQVAAAALRSPWTYVDLGKAADRLSKELTGDVKGADVLVIAVPPGKGGGALDAIVSKLLTQGAIRELVWTAAGAATRPLMEDHPDYEFPSDRVREAVEETIKEATSDKPIEPQIEPLDDDEDQDQDQDQDQGAHIRGTPEQEEESNGQV